MAVDPKEKLELETEATESSETTETSSDVRELYLRDGRKMTIASEPSGELVEVRASSGQLELRIKLTEDGPVLQMESVKLALRATESIDLAAKQVNVTAGEVTVTSEADTKIEAGGDVRVNGKMIYLN